MDSSTKVVCSSSTPSSLSYRDYLYETQYFHNGLSSRWGCTHYRREKVGDMFAHVNERVDTMEIFRIQSIHASDYELHRRNHWKEFGGVLYLSPKIGELPYSAYKAAVNYKSSMGSPYGTIRYKWNSSLNSLVVEDPALWKITSTTIINELLAKTTPKKIVSNSSKSETMCRFVFELLTGYSWISTRKLGIEGGNGRQLELDGYCVELKAAFEYQGRQHVSHIPRFHRDDADFDNQNHRDNIKKIWCSDHGVNLIEIPHYINHLSPLPDWIDFVTPLLAQYI